MILQEVKSLFNKDVSETQIIGMLSKMEFKKIGEGSTAYVFGDIDMNIVLKIFPPLNIGNPEDIEFIDKNPILKYADILSSRWQSFRGVHWVRRKAKNFIAYYQSKNIETHETKITSSKLSIKAYEISIDNGLMEYLPTRIIPNCISEIPIKANKKLMEFLKQPDHIILQKRFREEDILLNVLKILSSKDEVGFCKKLIERAVSFQVYLWKQGLTNTDMSFDMFDNLLLLPDGNLQIHDVNGINNSFKHATWYIHEKEKDIRQIFKKIDEGLFPQFLFKTNRKGILETARKLYSGFSEKNRDSLVIHFLSISRDILSEKVMAEKWKE